MVTPIALGRLHLPGMEIVNVYDRQCEAIFGSLQLANAGDDQQQRQGNRCDLGHFDGRLRGAGLIRTLAIARLAHWRVFLIR